MQKHSVHILPDDKTVQVDKDTTILAALFSAGIALNTPCGGDGVCGKCKVRVLTGTVIMQPQGLLSVEERRGRIYLACITSIQSDAQIEIPPESRIEFQNLTQDELEYRLKGTFSSAENIETIERRDDRPFASSPLTRKLHLKLPEPKLDDQTSDLERISRQIKHEHGITLAQTGLPIIRQIANILRDSNWEITVTLGKRSGGFEILFIEPSDTSARNYGIAFDIGTTTISGQLVNLIDNSILGTKATYNRQSAFGQDVISRILHAQRNNGLEQLHDAVVDTMNEIIKGLLAEHGVDITGVTGIVCAGNTTMIHLLLGIDPAYIRKEPYIPTASSIPVIRAAEAGLHIHPRGLLACMPAVASYVGADTVAGVLSSGLYSSNKISMLIDIGTNGEIVLGNNEFMISCAASAGPAFEGSGVTCGMRASKGAIQKVSIHADGSTLHFETIGGGKPSGICGSGYIHLLSHMLKAGILDRSGKIIQEDHPRVRKSEHGKEFIVVYRDEAGSSADIVITESDIENLKRAKGAIYSAADILIKSMDLSVDALQTVYIAGGFGTYLDVEAAVRIGLLFDIDRSRFMFIGNSSLAGARMALLSQDAGRTADELAKKITYCELSAYPGYMDAYIASLFFPHTDLSQFPSINKTG
jgi:uncharacterized 2Fe-2S/4Fe-4S cluster protein (DUF4445 family)